MSKSVTLPPACWRWGAERGELAHALLRAGHLVTAIDPRAPEGPIFQRVRLEEFSENGPFDYVVASLSLHHVEDLGSALDKIASLLRTGETLVVVEFAWDRINEATAEWALERLPAVSPSGKPSWLMRCCRGQRYAAEWAAEQGIHSSRQIRAELGHRFDERHFAWVPYLYPDLDEDTSEADEGAVIKGGSDQRNRVPLRGHPRARGGGAPEPARGADAIRTLGRAREEISAPLFTLVPRRMEFSEVHLHGAG